MKNSDLLAIENDRFVSNHDRVWRWLLRSLASTRSCPACGHRQNLFEASGIAVDDFTPDLDVTLIGCHCVNCRRELNKGYSRSIGWTWILVPPQMSTSGELKQ